MADPRIRRQTYTAASQPSRGAYPRGSVPPQAQRGVGSRGSGPSRATAGGNLGSGERQPPETAEQAAERELRERREQERAQEERERDARERKAVAAERLQREQLAVVSLERSVHAKARDVESLSAQSTQMDEQASAIRARAAVLHAHSLQINGFRAYLGAGNHGLSDCKARISPALAASAATTRGSRTAGMAAAPAAATTTATAAAGTAAAAAAAEPAASLPTAAETDEALSLLQMFLQARLSDAIHSPPAAAAGTATGAATGAAAGAAAAAAAGAAAAAAAAAAATPQPGQHTSAISSLAAVTIYPSHAANSNVPAAANAATAAAAGRNSIAAATAGTSAASAAPATPADSFLLSFPGGLADLAPIEWSELPVRSFLERARLHPEGLVAVLQGAVERKAEEIRRECAGTDVEEEGTRLGWDAVEGKVEEVKRECVGTDVEEEGTRLVTGVSGVEESLFVRGKFGLQGAVVRKVEEVKRECVGTDVEEEGTRLVTGAPLSASGGGTGGLTGGSVVFPASLPSSLPLLITRLTTPTPLCSSLPLLITRLATSTPLCSSLSLLITRLTTPTKAPLSASRGSTAGMTGGSDNRSGSGGGTSKHLLRKAAKHASFSSADGGDGGAAAAATAAAAAGAGGSTGRGARAGASQLRQGPQSTQELVLARQVSVRAWQGKAGAFLSQLRQGPQSTQELVLARQQRQGPQSTQELVLARQVREAGADGGAAAAATAAAAGVGGSTGRGARAGAIQQRPAPQSTQELVLARQVREAGADGGGAAAATAAAAGVGGSTGRGARAGASQQRPAPQSTQELVLARQVRRASVLVDGWVWVSRSHCYCTESAAPGAAVNTGAGAGEANTLSLSYVPILRLPFSACQKEYRDLCLQTQKEYRDLRLQTQVLQKKAVRQRSTVTCLQTQKEYRDLCLQTQVLRKRADAKEYRDLCLQTQVLRKRADAVRLEVERRTSDQSNRRDRDGAGKRGEEGGEEGEVEGGEEGEEEGGEEGVGGEEDVELGIAMAEAELRVLQAAEKRLSSEVAAAGATNRRVLQQWERIKGFNDERSNKWAEYELIRRINQPPFRSGLCPQVVEPHQQGDLKAAEELGLMWPPWCPLCNSLSAPSPFPSGICPHVAYAHMWWNLTNGQTQKALAGHVAKAGSALIGSVRAAWDLATHEVTAGVALPPSWLCRPVLRAAWEANDAATGGRIDGGTGTAADVAAGSAAELEPAVASMARQLAGLQQQAEQQHMEVLSEWLPQLAQLQGQARQLVSRTQSASELVSHWWKQPALGIIPWVTVEGRSMEEWAVALEAAQMERER
ncbi:unnamed protein product [Closterium sp. NIES-65]|nr:unnamed protein product [Closterium sp. NIES-65]